MDNIFDAERARSLAISRQASVSNMVRLNPDTASFLRRYEDSDVSRLKLLEAQRLKNEGEAQTKLIKSQQKRLKKRFRSGKGLPKGRGRQQKEVIEKSPLEVEIQREKQIESLKEKKRRVEFEEQLERDKLRVIGATADQRDQQEANRLAQERVIAQAKLDQTGQIFIGNILEQQAQKAQQLQLSDRDRQLRIDDRRQQLLIADATLQSRADDRNQGLIIADAETQRLLADSDDLRRLNADRLRIKQLQIDNHFQGDREERALRDRQLAGERERYNVDLRRVENDRDVEVARVQAELEGVRDRVARDDAFRHRELQDKQALAIEQLAEQRRGNTAQTELERNRIDNQRAVDAERAVTDRELIQGFTSTVQAISTQRDQAPAALGPNAADLAAQVRSNLSGIRPPSPDLEISLTQSVTPRIPEGTPSSIQGQERVPSEVLSFASLSSDSRLLTPAAPLTLSPQTVQSSRASASSDDRRLSRDSQRALSLTPRIGSSSPQVERAQVARRYGGAESPAEIAGEEPPTPEQERARIARRYGGVESPAERSGETPRASRAPPTRTPPTRAGTPPRRAGQLVPSERISERTGRPILIRQSELDQRRAAGLSGNVETIQEETTLQGPSAVSDEPIERSGGGEGD